MRLLWEGLFSGSGLIERANRELTYAAARRGHRIMKRAYDGTEADGPNHPGIVAVPGGVPADWHIRHGWVPIWRNRAGPLVLYQLFEYNTAPDVWIEGFKHFVDRLIVPSHADYEFLVGQGVQAEHVAVVPPGVNVRIYHPTGPILESSTLRSIKFLWVGELPYRDGLDYILWAYLQAFRRADDVSLIVHISRGSSKDWDASLPADLRRSLRHPDAPHIFVIPQPLSDEQLAQVMRAVDVLVAPYRGLALQQPLLEAMACGTPVAVSGVEPYRHIVPMDCGWYVAGRRVTITPPWAQLPGWQFEVDRDALVHVLRTVAKTPPSRKVRQRVGEHVRAQFEWDKIWDRWESVLVRGSEETRHVSNSSYRGALIWRGPIRNASGYAAESRTFLWALWKKGIVPRILDESDDSESVCTAKEESQLRMWERTSVDDNAIMIHNILGFRRAQGPDLVRTMFETTAIPPEWVPSLRNMDGILVPTMFNVETFSSRGIPYNRIHIVPSPVLTDNFVPRPRTVTDSVRFISVFDWLYRKGWDLLIKAWICAFTARDPVSLTIKTTTITLAGAEPEKAIHEILRSEGRTRESCAPITILNERWRDAQLVSFYQQGDIFVLPTRGEGWGRPILEAMACGLPVIATKWSGPAYYLSEDNSLPLRIAGLRTIPQDIDYKLLQGGEWAEPDLDHLVYLMRYAVNHLADVKRLGVRARQTAEQYHPDKVADQLMNVLGLYGLEPDLYHQK